MSAGFDDVRGPLLPRVADATPIVEVSGLKTHLFTRRGVVKAVDGVSFSVARGETLGIVGESGSGKTITALSLERLVPQPGGRIVAGDIKFQGESLLAKSEAEMREIRGRRIGTILQDPKSSLNPLFTIGDQVAAPMRSHGVVKSAHLHDRVMELLTLTRIPAPTRRAGEYPHQISGGTRQRVVGAIALSCSPALLIADEPTTALDVTTQALYLELLQDLQRELGLAIIVITHDFGVIAQLCDRVAVMYAGRIVETAPVMDLFDRPQHPYTIALLRSLPALSDKTDRLEAIAGQPPDLIAEMHGCPFAPRCKEARDVCRAAAPTETSIGSGHRVSCWARDSGN
jgi:oligopeptide/dipeptide ABC transporter ATP-binding protein